MCQHVTTFLPDIYWPTYVYGDNIPSELLVGMSLFDVTKLHTVEINTVFFTISHNDNVIKVNFFHSMKTNMLLIQMQ